MTHHHTPSGTAHGPVDHYHDHDHAHSLRHRLKHLFAHSHAPHERVDTALETHERGIRALKVSLLGLGVTALIQIIVVALSGSVALLADSIHNFADAGTSIPLWIAFALARRGATPRFTYGLGRAEDLAGVVIVAVIFASSCVAGFEAVDKLLHPQPIGHVPAIALAAIIGFVGNEAVATYRIRVGRDIASAALIADGVHSRIDGFVSLAVLIGAIGVALGVPILDPIIGLAITVTILFIVKDAAGAIFHRLLDGIEPERLAQIEHSARHVPGVSDVRQVRARWLGHKIKAELDIAASADMPLSEADSLRHAVAHALARDVPALGDAHIQLVSDERQAFIASSREKS